MRKTCGVFTGSTMPSAGVARLLPGHVVLPEALTGVKAPIVVLLGRRFPMIGAHKVLAAYALPGAAAGDRPVRSEARSGDLAVHRKLLPRRHCHIAHSRLPRRGRAAGGHEPGAFRLAAGVGFRSRRHHPHAGNREQRQGNLRQVRRARARQGQRHSQSVLRIRQLPDPLSLHRSLHSIACSRT